jgi:hypothetical protein
MLAIAFKERAFKDFNTFDKIFNLVPPLNHDPRMLRWANPRGAMSSVSIDVLNVLKQQPPSSISSSTSDQQRNDQSHTIPGASAWRRETICYSGYLAVKRARDWHPGYASYYLDGNIIDQLTSSTDDNQLDLAGAASPPSEAVIGSLEDGIPTHSQAAGSISCKSTCLNF